MFSSNIVIYICIIYVICIVMYIIHSYILYIILYSTYIIFKLCDFFLFSVFKFKFGKKI